MFFFKQPEFIVAEVFTRVPEELRKKGVVSDWIRGNRRGNATHSFLEGPVFDTDGNLYVTDVPYGRIFKIDGGGKWTVVVEYEGEPNGMKFIAPGKLLVADYMKGLITVDVATGAITPFLQRRNSESFRGLNDLTLDSKGNIYFTDQGQSGLHDPCGRVFRYEPSSGRLDMLLANIPSPNGLVLSLDETVLFVGVTRGNCIWRAPLQLDGSTSKVSQFFTSYGPAGPDGLAMDRRGRLIMCNPGLGYAWILNGRGEPEAVVTSPEETAITNVALRDEGGAQVAYFTESGSGSILRATIDAARR